MSKFDEIKIPENIKFETKKTIQKGRILKKKNKMKYIKVSSILIFSLGIGIGSLNLAAANDIPFFNNLFEKISDFKGTPTDYTQYSKGINLSKTINGITFTIDDVVYDGHQLNFAYTIKSQNKLPRQNSGFYKNLLSLEEVLTVPGATVTKGATVGDEYIDDYTYTLMQSYDINFKGKKAPKTIKLDFVLNKIFTCVDSGKIEESINETFKFKFKVDSNVTTKVIDINETKDGITLESIELTPYSITANIKFPKSFISYTKGKSSSIELSTDYNLTLNPKVYDEDLDTNTYQVKRGIVFDSVVCENVYGIGFSSFDDYVIVKFENFNNKSDSDITEFKINLK